MGLAKVLRGRCRRFPVRPLNLIMSEEDINMGSFIRDTLRSLQVKRDKNFDSPSLFLVSTESKKFVRNEGPTSSEASTSGDLLGIADSLEFPFRITINNKNATFRVSSRGSSITNGTNGSPVPISGFDEDIAISGDLFVVAEAHVNEELVIPNFTIKMTSETQEVDISEDSQTKLRLFIGKVYQETNLETGLLNTFVRQAVTTAYRTSFGFFNGTYVKFLEPAPSHPSSLVD